MADDQGEKEEQKFEFDSAGEALGYISLDQARVLAMQTAREAPGAYGRRFRNVPMAFEVVEDNETEDHYMVTMSFRPQGQFTGAPGQEQFFIEKEGTVAQWLLLPRLRLRLPVTVVVEREVVVATPAPLPTATPTPFSTSTPITDGHGSANFYPSLRQDAVLNVNFQDRLMQRQIKGPSALEDTETKTQQLVHGCHDAYSDRFCHAPAAGLPML